MHENRKCEYDNESKQGIIVAHGAGTVTLPSTLSQNVVIVLIFNHYKNRSKHSHFGILEIRNKSSTWVSTSNILTFRALSLFYRYVTLEMFVCS